MAIDKQGYKRPIRGTLTVPVVVDEDGNIAAEGEGVGNPKNMRFTVINANNEYDDNVQFLNIFLTNFGGAEIIESSNKMQVTWEAE